MTATTPTTYTGESAKLAISGQSHTTLGIGDFSLNMSRAVVTQELVGEKGNYTTQGALGIDGSFTNCQFGSTATDVCLRSIINGEQVSVSGNVGANSLAFYFASCQITGFDLTLGDADTVTEGSMDWHLLNPFDVSSIDVSPGRKITA